MANGEMSGTAEPSAEDIREVRRRLTDALHAMHRDQAILIDLALVGELRAAWDAYDAALTAPIRTELAAAIAREASLRDALTAAVDDIETLRAHARGADSYRFVHGFVPTEEEAEIGQRIIRNQEVARALLAELDTASGEKK